MRNVKSAVEMNEVVYSDESGNLTVFTAKVISKIYAYRQASHTSLEAGGVLIGERRGDHLIIHEVSVPGWGDIRTRYSVDRRGKHHQKAVNSAFDKSSGTLQYLGEWHTHPEDYPLPSHTDLTSWNELNDKQPLVLFIVGIKKNWAAKKSGKIIVLKSVT